jgi:outer membrane protein
MKSKLMIAALAILTLVGLTAQAQTTAAATPKIGWTNVDYLIGVLPDSKKITNEMQIQRQQIERELENKKKEFEEKYKIYEANAAKWSEIIRADKEKELQDLQTKFQTFQRDAEESLGRKQNQLLQPVLTKINDAIQAVGKEAGYTYILNMDAGANTTPIILYSGSEENNVSNLILKKLGVDPAVIEKQAQEAAQKAAQQMTPAPKPATPATGTTPKKN